MAIPATTLRLGKRKVRLRPAALNAVVVLILTVDVVGQTVERVGQVMTPPGRAHWRPQAIGAGQPVQ